MQFGTKTLKAGICPADVTTATGLWMDTKPPPGCRSKHLCQHVMDRGEKLQPGFHTEVLFDRADVNQTAQKVLESMRGKAGCCSMGVGV